MFLFWSLTLMFMEALVSKDHNIIASNKNNQFAQGIVKNKVAFF